MDLTHFDFYTVDNDFTPVLRAEVYSTWKGYI